MIGIFVAGIVGYYAGLYSFLWTQLYTPHKNFIKKKKVSTNYLKYDEL